MAGAITAILCGKLITGLPGPVLKNAVVEVADHKIVAIGSTVPAAVVDLSSYTCLPGLIDLHTHLTDDTSFSADPSKLKTRNRAESLELGRKNALATLLAGFTSVRDVGAYAAFSDVALRDEISSGKTPGPRMQAAGYYLTIPGGGGDIVGPDESEKDLPEDIRYWCL